MTQVNWINSKAKKSPLNVPVLMKVSGIDEVVYGWRCASDGHLEVSGYYMNKELPENTEYEWCYLPK